MLMSINEPVLQYEHERGLTIKHWQNKRDVFMITTCIPDSKTLVLRCGVDTTVSTVFHTYNSKIN